MDGAFGPGTKAAVEAFQRAAGIEATGVPDQRTLATLFYGTRRPQAGGATGGAAAAQQQRPAAGSPSLPRTAAPTGAAPGAPAAMAPGAPLDLNLAPLPRSP